MYQVTLKQTSVRSHLNTFKFCQRTQYSVVKDGANICIWLLLSFIWNLNMGSDCYKSTLFHAGSDTTYSPYDLQEKRVLPNSFCTPIELPKNGLHTKKQVSISKNKKMAAVLKSTIEILQDKFRQYFAFFTSSH